MRQETLGASPTRLAEPLWTDSGLKSESGVCKPFPLKKERKKRHGGNDSLSLP